MHRRAAALIAMVTIAAFTSIALAQPALKPAAYLPAIRGAEQTPTFTPTATRTVGPRTTATITPSPSRTPIPPTLTLTPQINTTATPRQLPPSYNDCQLDPNQGSAPDYPIRIFSIDKVAETVTLQNESGASIDLTGWTMCSVTGNQHHPIGGILAAGEIRTYQNTGGPIWNNDNPDPGALYNPAGQLVSDWNS